MTQKLFKTTISLSLSNLYFYFLSYSKEENSYHTKRKGKKMSTKTILLINDDPSIQGFIQNILNHLGGWQVLKARSSLHALKLATQAKPDAILFDLSASGLGLFLFSFLTELRSQAITQSIPVMVIGETQWLHTDLLQEFSISGVIDYSMMLTKLPQQISQLLNWDQNN